MTGPKNIPLELLPCLRSPAGPAAKTGSENHYCVSTKFFLTVTLNMLRIDVMKNENRTFTLDELCALVAMNKRKIRFYMQKGLVERPEGSGKGAFYTRRHLEQLLVVRKWKEAGLTLERIQDLLGDETTATPSGRPVPPPRPRKAGSVEVWSHLHIADGVELHIEPQRSGLTPEQVRALCRAIVQQYETIQTGD